VLPSGTFLAVNKTFYKANLIMDKQQMRIPKKLPSKNNLFDNKRFFGVALKASFMECEMHHERHLTDQIIDHLRATGTKYL
jgi:hypothetical protein